MQYDYLIVGQGLAGTLMAHRLLEAGQKVMVLDAPEQGAASDVAAGIINPITGRYFVKSWQIDALLPAAKSLYLSLEQVLGQQLWYDLPLARTLAHQGDLNQWEMRSADEGYQAYMEDHPDIGAYHTLTKAAFAYAGVRQTARVEIGLLSRLYRQRLQQQGLFFAHAFDPERLSILPGGFEYETIQARRLLFCEGWRAKFNPWFDYLPLQGMKGEILRVQLDGSAATGMLKQQIFLVPTPDHNYWVGATNAHQFSDDSPTAEKAAYLQEKLAALLQVPYHIRAHEAAIRPTVKDRKPLLGQHPQHKNMYIFNGLGTKGTSLAPLCSQWMLAYLLDKKPLPAEVDVHRFAALRKC